jgi:hypothetical protein
MQASSSSWSPIELMRSREKRSLRHHVAFAPTSRRATLPFNVRNSFSEMP